MSPPFVRPFVRAFNSSAQSCNVSFTLYTFHDLQTKKTTLGKKNPQKAKPDLKARRARRPPALRMLSRSARSLRKHLTGVRAFASGSVPDVMVRNPSRTTRERAAADRDFFFFIHPCVRRFRDSYRSMGRWCSHRAPREWMRVSDLARETTTR